MNEQRSAKTDRKCNEQCYLYHFSIIANQPLTASETGSYDRMIHLNGQCYQAAVARLCPQESEPCGRGFFMRITKHHHRIASLQSHQHIIINTALNRYAFWANNPTNSILKKNRFK